MTVNSTFDRILTNPERRQQFEEGCQDFLLAELSAAIAQGDDASVSELLTVLSSKTDILSSSTQTPGEMTLKHFLQLLNLLGYELRLQQKVEHVHLVTA